MSGARSFIEKQKNQRIEKEAKSKKRGARGGTRKYTHEEDFSILDDYVMQPREEKVLEEIYNCEFCGGGIDECDQEMFRVHKSCKLCNRDLQRIAQLALMGEDYKSGRFNTTRRRMGNAYVPHVCLIDESYIPIPENCTAKYNECNSGECVFCGEEDVSERYEGLEVCVECSNFVKDEPSEATIRTKLERKGGKSFLFFILRDGSYVLNKSL